MLFKRPVGMDFHREGMQSFPGLALGQNNKSCFGGSVFFQSGKNINVYKHRGNDGNLVWTINAILSFFPLYFVIFSISE